MRAIFLMLILAACAVKVAEDASLPPVEDYPVIEDTWNSPTEFCIRHTKAAKEDPAYIVDICVIECVHRPTREWCPELMEIINDPRGNAPSPD